MYIMTFSRYLIDYDKDSNTSSNKLLDTTRITEYEEIIQFLLEVAICGVISVDNIDDIDITNDLYKFYSKEWLNLKEFNYDNCIYRFVKEDDKVIKEVYSFNYDDTLEGV